MNTEVWGRRALPSGKRREIEARLDAYASREESCGETQYKM